MSDFVYIDEYGLLGINYYWDRRKNYGMSEEELKNVGVKDNRVRVHRDIIEPLQNIDKRFQKRGYRLYIKEGYRPKALYQLAYQKRVEKYGKEETDRLLNMDKMPHASGKTVDVTLWNPKEEKEVYLRNGDDGTDALFVDFYKNKHDEQSQWYYTMQKFVIDVMLENGFRLGVLGEYFHFDYAPDKPHNY